MWVPQQKGRIQQSNNNKLLITKRSNQSFPIPKNGRWGICDANGMFQWTGSFCFGGEDKRRRRSHDGGGSANLAFTPRPTFLGPMVSPPP